MDAMTVQISPSALASVHALLAGLNLESHATPLVRACNRALSRAAVSGRVVMVREVAADLGVKQDAVKPYIRTRPSAGSLESRIYAWGKRGLDLIDLQASGPEPSRGKGGGVRVKARQSRYPHAFIATMPSGHRGVFQREPGANRRGKKPNRSQLPIQELRTERIPVVFARHRAAGVARASESLGTNLVSEIKYALQQSA